MFLAERYTAMQFALARAALGVYLAVFFFWLAPQAGDLYARSGMYGPPPTTPFPNLLDLFDAPVQVTAIVLLLGALSLVFAAGIARRPLALIVWYGYACLFEQLPYAAVPQGPFIGWLLLASCLVPPGEPAPFRRAAPDWRMPGAFLVAAWLVLAVPYTASGISKLGSPSFVSGDAIAQLLESPIGRHWWLNRLALEAPLLMKVLTWWSLGVELCFAPLCLFARGRAFAWYSMTLMHVGIVAMLGIADVPIGMLVYHLFVFDVAWLPRRLERAMATSGTAIRSSMDAARGRLGPAADALSRSSHRRGSAARWSWRCRRESLRSLDWDG